MYREVIEFEIDCGCQINQTSAMSFSKLGYKIQLQRIVQTLNSEESRKMLGDVVHEMGFACDREFLLSLLFSNESDILRFIRGM